jgi:hypothetical protein
MRDVVSLKIGGQLSDGCTARQEGSGPGEDVASDAKLGRQTSGSNQDDYLVAETGRATESIS